MENSNPKFAIIGLGFISDRHLEAIENVKGKLIMACDTDPSKIYKAEGAKFFTDWREMYNSPEFRNVDVVSVCTPNYLHYEMSQEALRIGKVVLCEKPPIIDLAYIKDLDRPNFNVVLQLRENEKIQELQKKFNSLSEFNGILDIDIHRGDFYMESWKIDETKSGGLAFNIGVHYIDLIQWFFGIPDNTILTLKEPKEMTGQFIWNQNSKSGKVDFHFSIKAPMDNQKRILAINGDSINLSRGFENLHTKVYESLLKGKGTKMKTVILTLELTDKIRNLNV